MPLGGTDQDMAGKIQQTVDEGYIVAGHSDSTDGDVSGNNGQKDLWIAKLDREVLVENIAFISGLTLFPNPTNDKVTLTSHPTAIGKEYLICDVSGRIVVRGIITTENLNITMSSFSSGTYILEIDGHFFQKIMLRNE
jgi:hypothetical protein